jgi:hypothetical protein
MSSSDRKPYERATSLTQAFLNATNDNLSNQVELIVDIEAPDGSIIRASDRNKYVGEHFYEALTTFPDVSRTIGEFLGQGIVFSEMTFELSNVDGRFNKFLPGGDSFGGWIGRLVTVKIGLRDVADSYVAIFRGAVTEEGGFARSVKSITIKARDILEKININFPPDVFTQAGFPKAADDLWGTTIPVIYGDWTVSTLPGLSSVPAKVVNGADIFVNNEELSVTVIPSPDASTPVIFQCINHRLSPGYHIDISSDNPNFPSHLKQSHYVISVTANEFTIGHSPTGGSEVYQLTGNDSVTGNTTVTRHSNDSPINVALVISANANTELDLNQIYLRRSEIYYRIPATIVQSLSSNNNYFELLQDSSAFQIEQDKWIYNTSDEFFVRVKGKDLNSYSDNIVGIAKDVLKTYGGVSDSDFDSSWQTYADKSSPATSAVSLVKGRAYIGEPQNAMEYAVSLLEQVRLELFFNRSQKIDLSALHWDEFIAHPDFIIRNWDVEKDSLTPQIDDRNNFNRMRAVYSYLPDIGDNAFSTGYYRNSAAILQSGKEITKLLIYPNLYIESDVVTQATETLKLVSGYREIITLSLTNRAILKDLGEWVTLDVQIGSTQFVDVPCQIREISYSPNGLKLPMRLWAFTMLPFTGWNPEYTGIVGGQNATIVGE